MRFYQEITLIKTPDISPYFVWSKLYTQVHLALVEQQNPDKTVSIGVSFPAYHYVENEDGGYGTLGDKLRVFANSEQELERLNLQKRSEEHTSELQSRGHLVCRLLLEK